MILFSFAYLVSTAMRLTVNNTTATKLPFSKRYSKKKFEFIVHKLTRCCSINDATSFQCYSDEEDQLVFGLKGRYTSLKRKRFERI